ncbi:MAG: LCP family protein [Chloroflexota bacterium]|nr:LCP family protein [Chloroflexota bacterium]MCY3582348.1 LCP family protein [Chloroflexota bacterium]MDE2652006.1 LCP family protein [Chloroflexota bacterium]MXV94081.1 LytR family transcriptional regulator [Chloroflexota bacterium]MXX50099.1 LytR family transcriptional regulator [Chloroflexota bacterium]
MTHRRDDRARRRASTRGLRNPASPPAHQPPAPVYSTAQYTRNQANPPLATHRGPMRLRPSSYKRRRRKEWLWATLAGSMIAIFGVLIVAMFVIIRAPQAAQVAIPTAFPTASLPTPVDARSQFIADGRRVGSDVVLAIDGSPIDLRAWDGENRYTIVIGGLDRRPGQTDRAALVDSIILLSIDPQTKRVGLLSIPRDLYVTVPGEDERQRINRAHLLGEWRSPNGGGALLLQQTLFQNLGMRIHNYVLMDFTALIQAVDQLGGIEVTIDYDIADERYPDMNLGYDPFYLAAGTHWLDGYDALRFARTRHGNNDVRRAERQQQVIYAIRDRALSLNFLDLLGRLPGLMATLNNNIYTGLSLEEIIQLAIFVRDIELEDITMRVMNFQYVQEHLTDEQYPQQVLLPIEERLPSLLSATFGADYAGY